MPSSASPQSVDVHLLPDLANPHELAGRVSVVIDTLRACTTLAAAIAAGCRQVVPCLEVAEARQLAGQRREKGPVLLGGERSGMPIDDFDLGNSPAEYTVDRVSGRTIVFTTTNGTRALMRCVGAGRVLIASFSNLSAVAESLQSEPHVDLICAGTDGHVSWEDTLLAGALVDRLARSARLSDSGLLALQSWRQIGGFNVSSDGLAEALRQGRGGQNLIAIDRADDILYAARVDRFDVVPVLNLADWSIVPEAASS